MARSVFVQRQSEPQFPQQGTQSEYKVQYEKEIQFPMFWRKLLVFVTIGKGAVAGTGLALAGLGALDIAFAATANDWLQEVQRDYVNYFALGGGAVGAAWGLIRAVFFR